MSQRQAYEVLMKKTGIKWLVILVVMISSTWIFLNIVSVKETISFSSSDDDILNTLAANKIFSFFTIFGNQGSKKEIFYEKLDKLENVNDERDESVEDKASEDQQCCDQ